MKILVTGGAGYIGSHMCRMLNSNGHESIVLDTLEFGHRESLPKNVPIFVGDVGDEAILHKIFSTTKIDAVMHFAGYLQVEESVKFPIKYMQNNVISPVTLLETMKSANLNKIIFSSTAAVYGNPERIPIPEHHRKAPVSPYGLSKWAFEELLRVYDRSSGIKSITLRYFNAAGASLDGMHGEVHIPETHLIPLSCKAALGMGSFSLFGTDYDTADGTALRDFIHIEDLCSAHMLALDALMNGHSTDIYNVGTGVGISVGEVVSAVNSASGAVINVKKSPRRKGDPAILVSNPEKIMREFAWKPTYSDINTIVTSALSWHKNHPNGYTI